MTHDEALKLMAGYATGSLTEAERKALMEAALEDQGLFDELADEAALKEVLDEPGARQRLLAALEPPRRPGWLWALVPVTLAIVIGFVVFKRQTPPPQQIAQVLRSSEPIAAPALPPPPAPVKRKAAPAAPPRPPSPAPPAEVRQEKLADQINPQAFGTLGGAAPQALRAKTEAAAVTVGFGFSYTVLVGGALQITPAEPGFLTVIAGDTVLLPSNPVPAFTPVTIPVPSGANSVIIGFSRMPAVTGAPERRDTLTGRETDQDPPHGRILIQLSLKPATQ
jgi:hypothetical protein